MSRDAYILTLVLIAGALVLWSMPGLPTALGGWGAIVIFALTLALADLFPIAMSGELGEITVSTAVVFASAILFGPVATIWVALLGTSVAEVAYRLVILKHPWNRVPFNVSQVVISMSVVSIAYVFLADNTPTPFDSSRDIMALIVAGLSYYTVNHLLVSVVIALDQGFPLLTVWRIVFRDALWHNLAMIPLGAILALLWTVGPWSLGLVLLPLVIVRRSMALVRESLEQTRQALIALADTIDARDSSTYQHSQRVAEYAEMTARQMRLPYDELELIVTSARLHDLGKIGMDNVMLYKPGPLSNEERRAFQRHPSIGESLVGYFPAFGAGRDIVRHHHEHFDGRGYPNGKRGEEIALGARI
ncbi:MAG: HD domain-containing phosphohydrolase, partial [Anaerolineae bacterium]